MKFRVSRPEDVPALKGLWSLAFHDEGAYVQHFFQHYCSPDKMLVMEEGGEILAMTAWFGSDLHLGDRSYPFAYLYAVATQPDRMGQGIASDLLGQVYQHLQGLGFCGVTTVPAEPSLHRFFGRNGFSECFLQEVRLLSACPAGQGGSLESLGAADYQARRRVYFGQDAWQNLEGQNLWVDYDFAGHRYQEGVCALGRGGLFALGDSLCTLEEGEQGLFVVKELLTDGSQAQEQAMLCAIWQAVSPTSLEVRRPVSGGRPGSGADDRAKWGIQQFGMVQWLETPPKDWTDDLRGFLGMGYD